MGGQRGRWRHGGQRGHSCLKSVINGSGDKTEKKISLLKKLLSSVESLIIVFKLACPLCPQRPQCPQSPPKK
ncbi:MAG: hypothetical protein LBB88_00915 [Planctomycetaceae bacterium]|nr:hypothetical protein [Planctomycetaceae bacterium]